MNFLCRYVGFERIIIFDRFDCCLEGFRYRLKNKASVVRKMTFAFIQTNARAMEKFKKVMRIDVSLLLPKHHRSTIHRHSNHPLKSRDDCEPLGHNEGWDILKKIALEVQRLDKLHIFIFYIDGET